MYTDGSATQKQRALDSWELLPPLSIAIACEKNVSRRMRTLALYMQSVQSLVRASVLQHKAIHTGMQLSRLKKTTCAITLVSKNLVIIRDHVQNK